MVGKGESEGTVSSLAVSGALSKLSGTIALCGVTSTGVVKWQKSAARNALTIESCDLHVILFRMRNLFVETFHSLSKGSFGFNPLACYQGAWYLADFLS